MLDLKFLKRVINSLTVKNPNFLVIEVINHYLQATLIRADFSVKNILICKNWIKELYPVRSDSPQGDPSHSHNARATSNGVNSLETQYLLKEVKKILKKVPKKADFNIILNLDSNLALTIYSSVSLVRPKPKELIDESDLDNLISQAIWRFFDKQRPKAAKKMSVEEIDVLLADVRIRGVKVDGHKVVNPLGFKAKSVEVYLSETFAVRDFIRGVRELTTTNKIIFVSEAGTTLSHTLLNSVNENKPLFLANLFPDQTAVFHASTGHLKHVDNFNWGGNSLLENLNDNFKLDNAVSKTLIEVYNKKSGSPYLIKKLENIFMEEYSILANGIESLAPEIGKVYINPYFNFPSCLISERFESKFNKNFKVELLSTELVMKKMGFTIQFSKSVKKIKNLSTLSSVLLEIYLMPKNEKINYLANRRVRWLLS